MKQKLIEIEYNMNMHDGACPDYYYHIKTILRNQRWLISELKMAIDVIKFYAKKINHTDGTIMADAGDKARDFLKTIKNI